MSMPLKYGVILAGLLAIHPDTKPAQAGTTIPKAPTVSAGPVGSPTIDSGEIPPAVPPSGALGDRGASAVAPKSGSSYDQLIIAWWR